MKIKINYLIIVFMTLNFNAFGFKFKDVFKSKEGVETVGTIVGQIAENSKKKEENKNSVEMDKFDQMTSATVENLNWDSSMGHGGIQVTFKGRSGHRVKLKDFRTVIYNDEHKFFDLQDNEYSLGLSAVKDLSFLLPNGKFKLMIYCSDYVQGYSSMRSYGKSIIERDFEIKDNNFKVELQAGHDKFEDIQISGTEKLRGSVYRGVIGELISLEKENKSKSITSAADALDIPSLKEKAKNSGKLNFKGYYLGMPKLEYLAMTRHHFSDLDVSFDDEGKLSSKKNMNFDAVFEDDKLTKIEFGELAMTTLWKRVGELKLFVLNFANHYGVEEFLHYSKFEDDILTRINYYYCENSNEGYSLRIGDFRISDSDRLVAAIFNPRSEPPKVKTALVLKSIPKAADTFD